jgi:hypothetical protein
VIYFILMGWLFVGLPLSFVCLWSVSRSQGAIAVLKDFSRVISPFVVCGILCFILFYLKDVRFKD